MTNTYDYILKKFNITYKGEYFIDIPQMQGSVDLAKLFAELGFTYGAEIGTDQGEYAEVLLNTIPNLNLICVDPWKAEAYEKGQQPESGENQKFFDVRYAETVMRLKKFSPKVDIRRQTSLEANKDIADNLLDFVYIDGNHDFLNVTQDIHYWLKKVKPGGIISGHDYCYFSTARFNHVKRVVQAYALSYHIFPVFAVSYVRKGLKRDRFRSWFIVKR